MPAHNAPLVMDERFFQFCNTDFQTEAVQAVIDHGSENAAAIALGIKRTAMQSRLNLVRKRAAKKGVFPEATIPVPSSFVVKKRSPGYDKDGQYQGEVVQMVPEGRALEDVLEIDPAFLKKQSIYQGPDGTVTGNWNQYIPDAEQKQTAINALVEAVKEDIPRLEPVDAPTVSQDTLCNVYTLTDCHMGMLAWHEEGGQDWDLDIAERVISGVFSDMIERSPPASTGVIAQLGDFLHYDSLLPVTPTSGHILDADSRFPKLVRAAVRTLRRVIDQALTKHKSVYVLLAEGNHDMASSVLFRECFSALYENEPRVFVETSPLPYYCFVHGEVMLMWHHGHKTKNTNLPAIAASQFPKEWGSTTKRYAHCGDKHHKEMKEHAGIIVEQHTTLAARDAYAATHGWQSLRSAYAITYHDEFGEVGRVQSCPEMLAA